MTIFYIIIFTLINFTLCNDTNSEVEYIIYTSNEFSAQAERIELLYENLINDDLKLITQIIYDNQSTANFLQTLLFDTNNGYVNNSSNFINLKYLLIIGDETIIAPSGECINPLDPNDITATDDFFTTSFVQTESNCGNTPPFPKIPTGRLLINDSSSFELIDNIENYILEPYEGNWKSELLLFCDDQYKSNEPIVSEKTHIINSDKIYKKLKNNLNISCLYGSDFERQQSIDWFTQPQFTNKIIDTINNGVGIINYIGHGTSEFLADEDIITIADIESISITNNKLPIWVVGTCSFGNYLNENCLAEQLIKKHDAAIAVISTTGGISYNNNYNYLSSFFETHLYNFLNNHVNYENYRLGDIFYYSKNAIPEDAYPFNLFGDPAMPLSFPKEDNLLNFDADPILYVGSYNDLPLNNQSTYSLKIQTQEKYRCYCDGCEELCQEEESIYPDYVNCGYFNNDCIKENNCIHDNLISYNLPGDVLFFEEQIFSSNIFPYVLPIDANINDEASVKLYDYFSNAMDILYCIDMEFNDELSDDMDEDQEGPDIKILQNESTIANHSTIYPPYNIKIELRDVNPINQSGFNYHNLRIWFDDHQNTSIILTVLPAPELIDENDPFNYAGESFLTLDPNLINNSISVQAWDIFNNPNEITYQINFLANQDIYNIYNFPNPFSNKTFFTFGYANTSPIDVNIDIYSLNGEKIKNISEKNISSNGTHFIKIPVNGWDGYTDKGNKISNGTYIYHLKVMANDNVIHEDIYKLTKLE